MIKTYQIFSARLQYSDYNKEKLTLEAYNVEQVKEQISAPCEFWAPGTPEHKGGYNLNPFYHVIVDITDGAFIIEHNKHLQFRKAKN